MVALNPLRRNNQRVDGKGAGLGGAVGTGPNLACLSHRDDQPGRVFLQKTVEIKPR